MVLHAHCLIPLVLAPDLDIRSIQSSPETYHTAFDLCEAWDPVHLAPWMEKRNDQRKVCTEPPGRCFQLLQPLVYSRPERVKSSEAEPQHPILWGGKEESLKEEKFNEEYYRKGKITFFNVIRERD